MKSILSFLLAFIVLTSLQAQSDQQLTKVLSETNRSKLISESIILMEQSKTLKAIAVEAALQNGWPITMETETSFAELQQLDENGLPVYNVTDNVNAAITTSTNKIQPGGALGLNLTGTGMLAGEWDGGAVFTPHNEFNNTGSPRVTIGEAVAPAYQWHAAHVAGTIMGGGVHTSAKGMANNANLVSYDWNNDGSEMAAKAADGLLVSNHSYGNISGWYYTGGTWVWRGDATGEDNKFGFYNDRAALWDQIARDAPYYLIVKSAGNDRGDGPVGGQDGHPQDGPYDCIPNYGVAKNILTVGATEDVAGGYSGNPASVVMTDFSSWGPADDGRIKPDICGNGSSLFSAIWNSNYPTETTWYGSSDGTSMSTPNVTGSLLLLQELYENIYAEYMKSATLKALAIHTADECGPNTGPDYMFGWGLLNAATAANVITGNNVSSFIKELTYTGTPTTILVRANGTDPLKVTMVWTDPAGPYPADSEDPANIMLVNDLDMTVTGGLNHYPYKLDKNNPANAATTGDNDVDNVEQILVAGATSSNFIITITHEGSITGGSQNYSLIITGITALAPTVVTIDPTDIESTSVTFMGEATVDFGNTITERGFVYSTSPNPDIDDDKVVVGSGLGVFSTSVSTLLASTTYHVRAYAINFTGTSYGLDKSFTTDEGAPAPPTNVTATPSSIFQGQCSNLNATSVRNKIKWYEVATDGTPLATVNSTKNYEVCPNATKTYYAESFDPGNVDLQIANAFSVSVNGVFMDVTAKAGNGAKTIDQILFRHNSEFTPEPMTVYYRTGSYVGHETSISGWTFLITENNVIENANTSSIEISDITIPDGATYAFYIYSSDGNLLIDQYFSNSIDDGNVVISSGSATGDVGAFGATIEGGGSGTHLGVRYIGAPEASSETRTPVTVTVNPVTWTAGASTSNWATPGNWSSSSVPTISQDVVIPNITPSPVIASGAGGNCLGLTINSGATLTINSGGSLITYGTINNSGTVNVEKTIINEQWHYISSPVSGAQSGMFTGDYLQTYNETTRAWTDISSQTATLNPVQGYSFWSNDGPTSYTFTGTPNTGSLSKTITHTEYTADENGYEGANLIGNPYPSSIDWSGLFSTYGAAYLWNGLGYVSWNNGGVASRYIAPAQGFFIVTSSNGTFNITNDVRTHSGATSYYKSDEPIENGLVIQAGNMNYSDELWIMLKEQSRESFELVFDAWKFKTNVEGISQIYSVCSSGNLSIDVRPETETIQLGFTNDQNGNYSIALNQIDGIAQAELEDTKTNVLHHLLTGAYTFDWNTTDSEERFILHLKATGTNDLEAQAAKVYTANHRVYVRQSELNSYSQMAVYDMRGRLIVKKNLSATSLQSFELNESFGAYLVQLKGESGTKSFKIVL